MYAPFAAALSLGRHEVQSHLGQPLRLAIEIVARDPEESLNCFSLPPGGGAGEDGIPRLAGGVLMIDSRATPPRLIVTSRRPVNDPIVRVTLDMGCEASLRRDFVILLDPPEFAGSPTTAPQARAAPPQGQPLPATPSEAAPAAAAVAPGVGGGRPERPRSRRSEVVAERVELAPSPQLDRRDRLQLSRSVPQEPAVRARSSGQPRLRLSPTLSEAGEVLPLSPETRTALRQKMARLKSAPPDEDLRSQLDVEVVVLEKKIEQLQQTVSRLQAELARVLPSAAEGAAPAPVSGTAPGTVAGSAADNAPAADTAAGVAPPVERPQPRVVRYGTPSWLLWAVPVAVVLLFGLGVLLRGWRKRQRRDEEVWSEITLAEAAKLGAEADEVRREVDGMEPTPRPAATATPLPIGMKGAPTAGDAGRSAGRSPALAKAESKAGEPAAAAAPVVKEPDEQFTSTVRIQLPEPANPVRPFGIAPTVAVDEISHVTEEAGVYVALGHMDRAIEVLRDHVDHQMLTTASPWLMLLDLYRKNGQREEFEEVGTRFHQRFNVQAPPWEASADDPPVAQDLEEFPHLTQKVVELWGTPECYEFLHLLVYDNRGGARIGFSVPVFVQLMALLGLLEILLAEGGLHRDYSQPGAPPPPSVATASAPSAPVMAGGTADDRVENIEIEIPDLDFELDPEFANPDRSNGLETTFDVRFAPPPKPVDADPKSVLERDHPEVIDRLKLLWGIPECAQYLDGLQLSLEGTPQLSEAALQEVIMLRDVAHEIASSRWDDPWSIDKDAERFNNYRDLPK